MKTNLSHRIDHLDLQKQKSNNSIQSVLLILGMTGIMIAIGSLLAGGTGVAVALGVCAASAVVGPRLSPQLILRMYSGRLIHRDQSPDLYQISDELSRRARLPSLPTLYYIPSPILNAFAVGNEHRAAVAITDGILRKLSPREFVGVLAHEISHIKHRDTWVMGVADVVSRLTGSMSQIGQILLLLQVPAILMGASIGISLWQTLVLVFAPAATGLLQLALSRAREFHADAGAVELTADPEGLASALHKLEAQHNDSLLQKLFFPRQRSPEPAVLRTHPATQDRIERLRELVDHLPSDGPSTHLTPPVHGDTSQLCEHSRTPIHRRPRMHWGGLWY